MKGKIEEIAIKEFYQEKVASLKCFRGIETLTVLSSVVEIGDFRRFVKAEGGKSMQRITSYRQYFKPKS